MARLVARFGPDVVPWCAELPSLVARLCRRWNLCAARAVPDGGTSRAFRCLRGEQEVYLKLTPEPRIAEIEAVALRAWAGSGSFVTLLEADVEVGALLLEAVRPGVAMSRSGRPWTVEHAAALLRTLRTAAPDPSGLALPPLTERVEFVFGLGERYRASGAAAARVPADVLDHARQRGVRLALERSEVALVHGDFHPGNVLDGGARGPVIIDPRPCLGDPDFDAIDWVLAGARSTGDVRRTVTRLGDLVPGLDPRRVWQWCTATALLLAVGPLNQGHDDPATRTLLALADPDHWDDF